MKKFIKCLNATIFFSFLSVNSFGANIYVDQTLVNDCKSNNYSITSRNCSGSAGNAFRTIQSALIAMRGGDDIYLRGGTYTGWWNIPSNKDGTSENYSTIQSYTGEWAILDGNNNTSNTIYYAVIGSLSGLSYWEIAHMEIKNGRASGGSNACGVIYGGDHGHLHHLYIHDNYATTDNNNPGGIKIEHANDCTIEYNYLYRNGSSEHDTNDAQIQLVTDYDDATLDDTSDLANNIIQYNYINNAGLTRLALKHKNSQWIINSPNPSVLPLLTESDRGDKIRYNIIVGASQPLMIKQDYAQVYNNIIANSPNAGRIAQSGDDGSNDRDPFYVCVYNNTLIGTAWAHYKSTTGSPDLNNNYVLDAATGYEAKPYFYFYNNILESVGNPSSDREDLSILWTYGAWDYDDGDIDMTKVFVERNLFVPRTADYVSGTSYGTFDVGDGSGTGANTYSVNTFDSTFGHTNYAVNSTSGLHKSGSNYKTQSIFSVSSVKNISNGGTGGSHPYLSGVTIPSYVGATDPNNDGWVDKVLSLKVISNMNYLGSISSTSNTSSSSNVPPIPPAPTKLIVID